MKPNGLRRINRLKPLWTVPFEQPGFQMQVRSVTAAWFAGNSLLAVSRAVPTREETQGLFL